ncbi:hypothetical protein HPB50_018310 [Hyalomma asiaticum]|uniref:Uncharacterized protein n=1 Tax=Hyalomma asiaticum TaxID=266040 RepID=A0ACB7SFT9_HYAAI|nr:hypothetical protein HPB50_018310 [Hyalomma asiaticum]
MYRPQLAENAHCSRTRDRKPPSNGAAPPMMNDLHSRPSAIGAASSLCLPDCAKTLHAWSAPVPRNRVNANNTRARSQLRYALTTLFPIWLFRSQPPFPPPSPPSFPSLLICLFRSCPSPVERCTNEQYQRCLASLESVAKGEDITLVTSKRELHHVCSAFSEFVECKNFHVERDCGDRASAFFSRHMQRISGPLIEDHCGHYAHGGSCDDSAASSADRDTIAGRRWPLLLTVLLAASALRSISAERC